MRIPALRPQAMKNFYCKLFMIMVAELLRYKVIYDCRSSEDNYLLSNKSVPYHICDTSNSRTTNDQKH